MTGIKRGAFGIVGGLGPAAGGEMLRRAIDECRRAAGDQAHPDIFLSSQPGLIGDRTEFLEKLLATKCDDPKTEAALRDPSLLLSIVRDLPSTSLADLLGDPFLKGMECLYGQGAKSLQDLCTERETDSLFGLASVLRRPSILKLALGRGGLELENPAIGLTACIGGLCDQGARYVAIACNTAHARPIFGTVEQWTREFGIPVTMIHMIEETAKAIKHVGLRNVGLLATRGTYKYKLYEEAFKKVDGLNVIVPDPEDQERVHEAIYRDPRSTGGWSGIKHKSEPVDHEARLALVEVAQKLIRAGAQIIIEGCTEIPLAYIKDRLLTPVANPARLAASALVREARPDLWVPRTFGLEAT